MSTGNIVISTTSERFDLIKELVDINLLEEENAPKEAQNPHRIDLLRYISLDLEGSQNVKVK